jgi:hypothetical protein
VACGKIVGAHGQCPIEEVTEAHLAVAFYARIRRSAGDMFVDEIAHDHIVKMVLSVEDVKGDIQVRGNPSSVSHLVWRAASVQTLRWTGRRLAPQTHHETDYLVSLFDQQGRGSRAVDPATHSNDDATSLSVLSPRSTG